MASETIFAYVGPKGSGKTHEGALAVCKMLLIGRRVVAVIPDLSVERVHAYLSQPLEQIQGLFFDAGEAAKFVKLGLLRQFDETVDQLRRRLIVVDYDAVDQPGFWPDENRVRIDTDAGGGVRVGERYSPTAWREAVVWCGSAVVIDEAWRWLENARTIPKDFKTALHMARHWRGPLDWREDADVERWTADADEPWHPALGGPQGDGTMLVATNVLFLTQDYHALDSRLRKQVDQICDIRSFAEGTLPPLVQAIGRRFPRQFPSWNVDGKYSVSTFASHIMPQDRKSKRYRESRKSWTLRRHIPAIHGLFEKPGGQAVEMAFDKRSSASGDASLGALKHSVWLVVLVLAVSVFVLWRSFSSHYGRPRTVSSATAPSSRPVAVAPSSVQPPRRTQPSSAAVSEANRPVRIAGAVGGAAIVVDEAGHVHVQPAGSVRASLEGEFEHVDGKVVDRWSSPLGVGVGVGGGSGGQPVPAGAGGASAARAPVT